MASIVPCSRHHRSVSATTEALLALVLALGLVALPACTQGPQGVDDPEPTGQAVGSQQLGAGFVVWESARGGDWRIWTRRLDGSGLRQLTPDEGASESDGPGTRQQGPAQHCCPHLSPSGRRLVYLSRAVPRGRDARREVAGTLLLLDLDSDLVREGNPPRVLSRAARTYGRGHRAAVWRNEHELIYLDAQGRTLLLDVERHLAGQPSAARILVDQQDAELGWLIDPTLRYATTGVPSFSLFQPAADGENRSGRIAERRQLGGCEPYFSGDGHWGLWVHGAGGPLRAMRLDSRESTTLLRKNDSRLPGQGYTYFPMLSRDARLLAFAASPGGHDHYASNYDIFVAPVDPSTLQLLAAPLRLTEHPGSDRYPDVHLAPPAAGENYADIWTRSPPSRDASETPGTVNEDASIAWPTTRGDLLLLWQSASASNLVPLTVGASGRGSEPALESSVNLDASDLAHLDRQGRLQLTGGRFTAGAEWAQQVLTGARDRNELSVELTVQPLPAEWQPAKDVENSGVLVQLGRGGQTKLALHQRDRQLELRLQLGPNLETASLVELTPGQVHHVAFTYTPGRLRAYLDGEPVLNSDRLQRDFFRWRQPMRAGESAPGWLQFGPWPGSLEGVAIYGRLLDEAEVRAHAETYAQLRAGRPSVEARRVVAELVAKSATPTLDEIAPYVDALAIYEYRVLRWLDGGEGKASATNDEQLLRVVHWVILDAEELSITKSALGSEVELTLEPYAAQPQLPEHVLSETLEPRYDLDLWFALQPFP